MKLYLNAGNGGRPMGERTIRFIKDHLFDGVRMAVPNGVPAELLDPMLRELSEAELSACLLLGGWDWWEGGEAVSRRAIAPDADLTLRDAISTATAAEDVGLDFYVEIGNEPNLAPPRYKKDPEGFAIDVNVIAMALSLEDGLHGVQVISGGVSNINPWEGLPYLVRTANTLGTGVILGVHPYRMGNRPQENLGDQPIGLIADVVSDLHPRFAVTEGGWHTAPRRQKRAFPLCFSYETVAGWTDDEVARFADLELSLWAARGAEFYVWYQINDGLTNTQEDRFGIRTARDGSPKPVAAALRDWRAKEDRP